MIVQICSETDTGLARHQNEDSVKFDEGTGLCILADGMGGHNAGEVASGMATAFLKSELYEWIGNLDKDVKPAQVSAAVEEYINKANSAIYNMSRTNPRYSGMGTTLVVGVFYGAGLILAHIGDSRCYRLRGTQFKQLTKDHSVLQEQVDTGLVLPSQTLPRIGQNLVTRALGVADAVQTEINQYEVLPNDLYLMCSDGLSDMVSDDAIAMILNASDSLEGKAKQLIVSANENGGRDNISVVLAQVADGPEPGGLMGSARRVMRGVWPGWRG